MYSLIQFTYCRYKLTKVYKYLRTTPFGRYSLIYWIEIFQIFWKYSFIEIQRIKIEILFRKSKIDVSYFANCHILFLDPCTSTVCENFLASCINFRSDSVRIVITRHSSRNRRHVLLKNNAMRNGVQIRSI